MPVSICIKCGQKKLGPLDFCSHCGFIPKDRHDQARSILLSDQHRTSLQLDAAARDIRRQQVLLFDPAELQPVLVRLKRGRFSHFLGIRKSTWLIIGAAILAGAVVAVGMILLQSL